MSEQPVNPMMIVLARESRGWTQGELADAIGVSQSKIAKYELGSLSVSAEDAERIADALRYHPKLLYQTDPLHAVGASLLYRQRAGVPVRAQRQIEAEINIRKMQVARLLRAARVESDHVFPSIPVDTFNGNAAAVAREVRRLWKMPRGPIQDLTRLVESAGGIVIQLDFDAKLIDGASLWVAGLPPLFFMNRNAAGERYRFSLAHEIGHAVMHRASAIGEIEDEAHAFASEFLTPETDVSDDLRNFDLESARRLKAHWKVSMQALIERAHQLNRISYDKRRRLHTMISARGMRTEEPWPIAMERATSFDELVGFHRIQVGLSDEEIQRDILFTERLGRLENEAKPQLRLVGQPPLFPVNPDSSPKGPVTLSMQPLDVAEA